MTTFNKVIVQGRLDFGNESTYIKAVTLFNNRKEVYYKNEVIFKSEEVFDDQAFTFTVKRFVGQISDKFWRNSVHLMKNLGEYALAGVCHMWMMENGRVMKHEEINPSVHKTIVKNFNSAVETMHSMYNYGDSIKIFDQVLDKYPHHAPALAMKGKAFMKMGEQEKAKQFFEQSLSIDPNNIQAWLGLGKYFIYANEWESAREALEKVTENSIPAQNEHWIARRLKGKCYYNIGDLEKSVFEWSLFAGRTFDKESSNYRWKRAVTFTLGKAYMELGQKSDAILSFNNALKLDQFGHYIPAEEIINIRDSVLGDSKTITKTPKKPKASKSSAFVA